MLASGLDFPTFAFLMTIISSFVLMILGNPEIYSIWISSDLSLLASQSVEYIMFSLNTGFQVLL